MQIKHRINFLKKMATSKINGFEVITEIDLLNTLRTISNVMILPGSYSVEYPTDARDISFKSPWGPTIEFQFKSKMPPEKYPSGKGDPNLISAVENKISSKFQMLIHNLAVEYVGDGNYSVTITEKAQ